MSAWDTFIQLLPVLASIGGTAAVLSWRQHRNASLRSAWWDRTRWAVEQLNSADAHQQNMGIEVLHVISSAEMTPERDLDIFNTLFKWSTQRLEYLHGDSTAELEDNSGEEGVGGSDKDA